MADKRDAPKAETADSPFVVNGHPYDPDTGKYLDGPHPEEESSQAPEEPAKEEKPK